MTVLKLLLVPGAGAQSMPQHLAPHCHSVKCFAAKVCPYDIMRIIKADFSSILVGISTAFSLQVDTMHHLLHLAVVPGAPAVLPTPCPDSGGQIECYTSAVYIWLNANIQLHIHITWFSIPSQWAEKSPPSLHYNDQQSNGHAFLPQLSP